MLIEDLDDDEDEEVFVWWASEGGTVASEVELGGGWGPRSSWS